MCGRFALSVQDTKKVAKKFRLKKEPVLPQNYNIPPSAVIPTVIKKDDFEWTYKKWGLIPSWAKDDKFNSINARAETISEKPSFKDAFLHHRCLIPATGFYEWKREGKSKQPYYIHLKDEEFFAFAGIASQWKSPAGETIDTCAIITTEANEIMKPIHHRMPVIIKEENYDGWLSDSTQQKDLQAFLRQYPANEMDIYPVSAYVNSPKMIDAKCILPLSRSI